ncbi:hypothetical protein Pden_1016 [Paracoccus denitrificans PD1222]|uniref:Uncharacterized protein n=1 Tax=Paracoccus denitrificans (strain Pd 1222) TaxID=318586 RepID=A1B0T3_PARDP|nr:hypothetical protein Pden_1016 [Paracoccus denitrificans PD1222]
MEGLHSFPRRRPDLPDEQYLRTGVAGRCPREKGLALRRFARGGDRAAFIYSLIVTARMNDVDPPGLACRCSGPTARYTAVALARTTAVELEAHPERQSCVTTGYDGWLPFKGAGSSRSGRRPGL